MQTSNTLLPPASESDLEVFHALATGSYTKHSAVLAHACPQSLPEDANAFVTCRRAYRPGLKLSTPFYGLLASPSSKSVDEYNMLTIIRRRAMTGEWHDAATSESQPRLKLISQGIMTISRIELQRVVERPQGILRSLGRLKVVAIPCGGTTDAESRRRWKLFVTSESRLTIRRIR